MENHEVKKRTKSLLEEISTIAQPRNNAELIETRGVNILSSIINLLEMIEQTYDAETAQDLQKRMILDLKHREPTRFIIGIKKLRDNK
jgi:predicted secreted Zn-dependent protease